MTNKLFFLSIIFSVLIACYGSLYAGEGGSIIETPWENIELGMSKNQLLETMGSIELEFNHVQPSQLPFISLLHEDIIYLAEEVISRVLVIAELATKDCDPLDIQLDTPYLFIDGCHQTIYTLIEKTTLTPSVDLIPYFGIPEDAWSHADLYFFNQQLFAVHIYLTAGGYVDYFYRNYAKFLTEPVDPEQGIVSLQDNHQFIYGNLMRSTQRTTQIMFLFTPMFSDFEQYLRNCRFITYEYLGL